VNKADFAELVFGFVYGVGTDAEPVIKVLEHYLKQYHYAAEVFRISDQLRTLELGLSFDGTSAFERMGALMDAGNKACALAKDDQMLAVMAINEIASGRTEDEQKRPIARDHTAHLIRSLKRPEEVQLLRQVYRPGFFLIGIAAYDDAQAAYLTKEIGLSEPQANLLIERDQDEHLLHGQRTRKTFYLADVFVQRKGRLTSSSWSDSWSWYSGTRLGLQARRSMPCSWHTLPLQGLPSLGVRWVPRLLPRRARLLRSG